MRRHRRREFQRPSYLREPVTCDGALPARWRRRARRVTGRPRTTLRHGLSGDLGKRRLQLGRAAGQGRADTPYPYLGHCGRRDDAGGDSGSEPVIFPTRRLTGPGLRK